MTKLEMFSSYAVQTSCFSPFHFYYNVFQQFSIKAKTIVYSVTVVV